MFSRAAVRCSAPLRQNCRAYATETGQNRSSATPWIVGVAAIAAGYAGYSYLGANPGAAAAAKDKIKEVVPKAVATAYADAPKTFTGGEQGFVDLKLASVEPYSHNTKKFIFELPEKDQVSGLKVASAILTKFQAPDAEKPVLRPYTPVNDESEPGHLDLLVKVYPNGPMSEHIHALKPGDSLSFKGPLPKYSWTANKHTHISLIAGGTGITPMYQLVRAIFNNPSDTTKVSLIFGNVGAGDILLKEEFEKLEKSYPDRFRAWYTLDNPPEGWKHGKGFISKELLKEVLPDPKSENIKIFVCGPPGLYKSISGAKTSPQDQGDLTGTLKELGYGKDQVYKF